MLDRGWLILCSIRKGILFSAVVVYLVLPLGILLNIVGGSSRVQLTLLLQTLLLIQPMIWGMFFLHEYFEGDGRESLWYLDRVPRFAALLWLFACFVVFLTPLLLFAIFLKLYFVFYLPVLMVQSLYFLALFYLLTFVTRSSVLGFVLIWCVQLYFIYLAQPPIPVWSGIVSVMQPISLSWLQTILPLMLVVFIWGYYLERRFRGVPDRQSRQRSGRRTKAVRS